MTHNHTLVSHTNAPAPTVSTPIFDALLAEYTHAWFEPHEKAPAPPTTHE